ncbi:CopG family ribbon-helix-helix protein [Novosphingobium sp. BL-8H]|uniref:CopG family ribbon-helix-helix protein n=1 Tax=Novosphingobium sp. BL-8H TaxID=3127640 RepID=UPI003757BE88
MSHASLARLSMRLPSRLFRHLNSIVAELGLPSRSHWIAELIRNELANHGTTPRPEQMLSGTVTIVFRGDTERVRRQLARTQSCFLKEVISSQHVFLEDEQSMEVLIVQGPARRLRELSDAIRKVRGVQQLRLTTTTALLPPLFGPARGSPSRGRDLPNMPQTPRAAGNHPAIEETRGRQ